MRNLAYLLSAMLLALATPSKGLSAPERYSFDLTHTSILFLIEHAGFSKFIGEFTKPEGDIVLDFEHPEQSRVMVRLMPGNVDTDVAELDEKLQGEQFFNSKQHPVAIFQSTHVEITGKNTANVTGDLTLLGVTKPLVLGVTLNKHGYDKWRRTYKAGFSIRAALRRSDWGMNAYIPAVGDEVVLLIETEVERPLEAGEAY